MSDTGHGPYAASETVAEGDMRWLTDDELTRALNSAGVPKNRKTVRHWPRKAPGISRLIAGRRMFHPLLPELLLAGHNLRDIGTALAAQENGTPPNQLDLLPPARNCRGEPAGNEPAEMAPDTARELAEWGVAGREYLARRTGAGSPEGREFAARLESLPPAEAADEVRAMFALCAAEDLPDAIANDLQLDPEKAELIALEIQATRQRLGHATRPFRPIATEG